MIDAPRVFRRHLPEPTRRQLARRATQIAHSTFSHGLRLGFRQARHLRRGRLPLSTIGVPLRRVVEDLGGTFMKFGQMVASSPGLFGDDLAHEFRSCLDTGPVVPFSVVRDIIENDVGAPLEEIFKEFDHQPIGCASIAVVHRARLYSGDEVAVKVLRPTIEHVVAVDLDLLQPFIELLARATGDQIAGSMLAMVEGLRVQLQEELDLRNEARALSHFRKLQIDQEKLVVPKPYETYSGPNVLVMEFLHGIPIDDLEQIAALGYDPGPLVEAVVRAFFVTAAKWGAFHGDVHAGNMLLLEDGRLGIVDWGIVGRLDPETHTFFLRMLEGVLGDESAWVDITNHLGRVYGRAIQEGLGLDDEALAVFVRGLIEPTLTRPFGEVSLAALITAPQQQAAQSVGALAHKRSFRMVLRRLRAQRRMRRMAIDAGGLNSAFDRATFLLGKQLMYFERYGKLFMNDVPLLGDEAFLRSLVDRS